MSKYKCDQCRDTGWYGDNGPGIMGNREYIRCECRTKVGERRMTPADHPRIESTRIAEYHQGYAAGYAKGVQAWTWRDLAWLVICMGAINFAIWRLFR